MTDPVLVELTRGEWVESRHRGAIAIADGAGRLVWSVGDVESPVFARSALKMFQALPLVETGAADAYGLGDAELALACASHSGEPAHVETVRRWLAHIGCDETCLACGAHPPVNEAASRALIIEGRAPSRLHNNCSGKHAGFLTVARHLGLPIEGYEQPDHPVQRLALTAMAEMAGIAPETMWIAVDGCAAPAAAFPLAGLARAVARIADPAGLAPARVAAARRLDAAVKAEPVMIAGTGRVCTTLIRAAGGAASVKTGAEGVFVAALADLGLGVALKIDDGAGRASEVVISALLAAFGVVSAEDPAIAALAEPPVLNTRGRVVGSRRVVPLAVEAAKAAVLGGGVRP